MENYKHPLYYEIAFSFRNIKREVDFFESCVRKFSKIKVRDVLEIGCGNSPYLFELNKRGYRFTGLDLSKEMLNYTIKNARESGIKISTILADMVNFKARKKFDLALVMLGSIYTKSNEEFLSHLDSVAGCLRKGGLYLIDGNIDFDLSSAHKENWIIHLKNGKLYLIYKNKVTKLPQENAKRLSEKDGIYMRVEFENRIVDRIRQLSRETVAFSFREKGRVKRIVTQDIFTKYTFPQEFLELVKENGKFEFVGWYNNLDLGKPMEKAKIPNRPITILKRL